MANTAFSENNLAVSLKIKHKFIMIPFLGIYPTNVQTKTRTQMFIATLFMIAPSCKQFRNPPTSEWIHKL